MGDELPSLTLVVSRRGPTGTGGVDLRPTFDSRDGRQIVTVPVAPGTDLYGTGEVTGPLLRNGRTITLWNTDAFGYGARTASLYQSHPWTLGVRPDGTAFGVIFDSTYRQTITLPPLSGGAIRTVAEGPAFPVIIIERDTPQQVVMTLAALTGKMPLPPEWSLGYHQCRYSYDSAERARQIASGFRERHIPCDTLWLDIDYMDGYRIFTFNPERFPSPQALNRELHAEGFHTVWMIDPGLKSGESSPASAGEAGAGSLGVAQASVLADFASIREQGLRRDVYVKRADGSNYQGEVWPGWCFFPDFTRADTRAWWASLYAPFLGQGIDGVWNDMNEPSVFNTTSKTMPEDNVHRADPDLGGTGSHARYHNVFGMLMIRATREGMLAARPDRRPFVLSRANFLGGQRYGATWTGDNTPNWEQLAWSIPMVLNLGVSGQPDAGPDIGGFAGDGPPGANATERGAFFARWMGFGALLPFARGHTVKGSIDKEPWAFGPATEQTCRAALERRYRLLPYLYTVFREASATGLPVARPIFFADLKDPALRAEDRGFLLGDSLLVSARVTPRGDEAPALPRGWVRFHFPGEAPDPNLPELYIRPGAAIPAGPVMQFVNEKPLDQLDLFVALDAAGRATGTLYEDAGDGFGFEQGEYRVTRYTVIRSNGRITCTSTSEGRWPTPAKRTVRLIVVGGSE